MSEQPTPAPSPSPSPETPDPQKALLERFRPTIWLFAIGYIVTFVYHLIMRQPAQEGATKTMLLAVSVISNGMAVSMMVTYLCLVRKLPFKNALAFAGTLALGFLCGEAVRIFYLLG